MDKSPETVALLCERYALGAPTEAPVVAAAGAGGHNIVWRLETSAGVFAIKQIGRSTMPSVAAYEIECAAIRGGIPAPLPVASVDGKPYETIGDITVRCHEWVTGATKTDKPVDVDEARAMGGIVARLHGLRLTVRDSARKPRRTYFGEDHWGQLAERGGGRPWADTIQREMHRIRAVEEMLKALPVDGPEMVGSHRDLNAHNVLFGDHGGADGMVLVDWDAAGPAAPAFERAHYAVAWGSQPAGGGDKSRTVAFLRGYLDGGGQVDDSDPDRLTESFDGVLWWAEQNVQYALAGIGTDQADQDGYADAVLKAAIDVDAVAQRQLFLANCLRAL